MSNSSFVTRLLPLPPHRQRATACQAGRSRAAGRLASPRRSRSKIACFSFPATRKAAHAAAFERRKSQRDPHLGLPCQHDGNPAFALFKHRLVPGISDAVCPSSPRPSRQTSKSGRVGQKRVASVVAFEFGFVSCRRVVGAHALVGMGWMLAAGMGARDQHRFPRHAVVALRIVRRHEALVAPEPMRSRPRESVAVGRRARHS